MTNAKKEPQTSFEETVIEDADLKGALDQWNKKNESRKALTAQTKPLKEKVAAMLKDLELEPGVHRCGPFVITIKDTESRDVDFTINAKRQTRFRLDPKA